MLRVSLFLFHSCISYARRNFRKDSEPNHLEDSEMTPRSCLDEDSELKLLTSRCETTSVQSLPQSVRLLQSKLKVERLASAQLWLEVKDAMKMSENCLVHYHAIQLGVKHLSLTQLRSDQLLRLFRGATWPGLVPSEVLSVLYILLSTRLYALAATFDAQSM